MAWGLQSPTPVSRGMPTISQDRAKKCKTHDLVLHNVFCGPGRERGTRGLGFIKPCERNAVTTAVSQVIYPSFHTV